MVQFVREGYHYPTVTVMNHIRSSFAKLALFRPGSIFKNDGHFTFKGLASIIAIVVSAIQLTSAHAAVLATTTLTLNPQGSINTTGGTGSISGALQLADGDSLESFEVQWTNWVVSPSYVGVPPSFLVSLFSTELGPLPLSAPARSASFYLLGLGQTNIYTSGNVYNELLSLIVGPNYSPRYFYGEVSYPFGGVYINSTATVEIRAIGTPASSVPVPSTMLLFLLGTGSLFLRYRRDAS
jgi:hypothetical protein